MFWMGLNFMLIGYLLGSINSAIIVCKMMGLPSPRSIGSGNPGSTNVLRLGSKKAAALTLVGDVLKGVIPVGLAHAAHLPIDGICGVAVAAVLGHAYPLFFGFKGGKGVATGLGVLLGIHPGLGLLVLLTWLIVAGCFRYSSLAALVATILSPGYGYFLLDRNLNAALILFGMAVFIVFRHRENIRRLWKGEEKKIGK